MKLTDLDPKWIEREGRRIGMIFRCPHCQKCYLSCIWEPMPIFPDQYDTFLAMLGEDEGPQTVPSKPSAPWTRVGDDFVVLSVTPSIDASDSGHWHGFIMNGNIA